MEFTMLESFFSEELQSAYVKGLSYTAREPGPAPAKDAAKDLHVVHQRRTRLRELVPQWVEEGKAVYGRVESTIKGEG